MKQNKEILKQFFETGDKPTQQQYTDLIDSYVDAKQPSGEANRRFVIDETGDVQVVQELKTPEYTLSEIAGNKLSLLKDGVVVKEIDLTTYLDDTNLSRLVSGTVDPTGIATFKRDDNSTFTVDFSGLGGSPGTQIQSDWNQTDNTQSDFIKNKPPFENIIERDVFIEDLTISGTNIDTRAFKYFNDGQVIAGFMYDGVDYWLHGGTWSGDFTWGSTNGGQVYITDLNANILKTTSVWYEEFYNSFYRVTGERLPHWTSWQKSTGSKIQIPTSGYGTTFETSKFQQLYTYGLGLGTTSSNGGGITTHASYTSEKNDVNASMRIVEQAGNVIDRKFLLDGFELSDVGDRWSYITKTSQLENDGDGTSPFLTRSKLEIPEYSLSDINGNKLSLLKDGIVVKEIDLTTYLDDTNLSRLVSGTVDPTGIATFKRDDSSTFTVDFGSIVGSSGTQAQADWSQGNSSEKDFIKNAPKDLLKALEPLVKEEEYRLHIAPSVPIDLNSLAFDKNIVIVKNYNDGVGVKNYLFFKVSSNEPYTYTLYNVLHNSYEAHLFSGYSKFMKIKRSDDLVKSGYICFGLYSYNGGLPASSSGLHTAKLHGSIVKSLSSTWSAWRDLSFENNTITATRARWRKKGSLIHLEIVTLSIQDKGFVAKLPPEARPANSYYGAGSDNNGNMYSVTVNGLGGIYVHNPLMKTCTLFFHID